jgi:hypothetical protein
MTRILLHGVEGPMTVNGRRYAAPEILAAMPPVGMMDDEDLAAVCSPSSLL